MFKKYRKLSFMIISIFTLFVLTGCGNGESAKNMAEVKLGNGVWDKFFVKPIAWLLDFLTDKTGSFAVGIILITILVRTLLIRVYTKSNDQSQKMQLLQPEVKKIQAKYAGKTDQESNQKQQLEMMQLYKNNNVNILSGCLMPLIQMPVFMAMYYAVVRTPITFGFYGDESKLSFLWLNLGNPDKYYILPILVALTALLLQYISMYGLSPEAKNNPTMKIMTWMMPAMMLMFSFTQASALSLYWIVGNIYSTLQTIIVKKPFKKKL
ncbi:MAG: oxaA1 [Haloplasmataceae bacterium]|jgi:YidC/Oxa1 family membrane protein insertase|nr:oxaA1 [Haloplasmataceae bacterium]